MSKRLHNDNRVWIHRLIPWCVVLLCLILTGQFYRVMADKIAIASGRPITLSVPLSRFPESLQGWKMVQGAQSNANVPRGCDDVLDRFYTNDEYSSVVSLYVAYSARPRTLLGHRPEICFLADGWVHERIEDSQVTTHSGLKVPCKIHSFHKLVPEYKQLRVLTYYILSGEIVREEKRFRGLKWRTPNLTRNRSRYVAQVQMSSTSDQAVRQAAIDMTDSIRAFFPDKDGQTRPLEHGPVRSAME